MGGHFWDVGGNEGSLGLLVSIARRVASLSVLLFSMQLHICGAGLVRIHFGIAHRRSRIQSRDGLGIRFVHKNRNKIASITELKSGYSLEYKCSAALRLMHLLGRREVLRVMSCWDILEC